ncbi:MAG: DUF4339 domain-containing protein [Spirochaetaceae bacterium]|jgi:hypothetical protein|nr:DUF4339 domain-containing protein [Spirochaetaceae bacterium]
MYDEKSFYSIDRLVEFGMGMAIAQQMTQSMNQTMHIPGSGNLMQPPPQPVYYAVLEGKQAGPFSETELVRFINDRKLSKETYVWRPGLRKWQTAENVPEILRLVALAPSPLWRPTVSIRPLLS